MLGLNKTKASSRKQIAIEAVKDNILVLNKNSYRAIIEVSSLNFELKSESEQDVIIDNYMAFLNSLGSALQILIRTRQLDLDKYLEDLKARLADEQNSIFIEQLANYTDFIHSLVQNNRILSRRFFIIIPYQASPKTEFSLIKQQLDLKVEIVKKGIGRLNMHSRQLSTLEILDLFYSFYCPNEAKNQPLKDNLILRLNQQLIRRDS